MNVFCVFDYGRRKDAVIRKATGMQAAPHVMLSLRRPYVPSREPDLRAYQTGGVDRGWGQRVVGRRWATAMKRLGRYMQHDWWFCPKALDRFLSAFRRTNEQST